MNSTAVDFGNRVRSQREYLQFSQSAFAHKIGKTQSYVSLVENGKYYPDSDMREKISQVLNVSVKYLLGEESQVSIEKTTEVDAIPGVIGYLPWIGAEGAPVTTTRELHPVPNTKDVEEDEMDQSSDCKEILELVQKNLDHLFKVTGDQFFVSPKTSLYSISEICRHYKISVSYLFEDHEKEWLKEEIENKYKEIEQMEAKLASLDENK